MEEHKAVKAHTLNYAGGKLSVGGVTEVKSFDPKMVVLKLDGRTLTVKGANLAVTELILSGGSFAVSGEVLSLAYSHGASSGGLLGKLTK